MPVDIILGIVGVETFYGENTGRHRVIDALSTLAFDYPPRAEFFRGELEQFLLMTREEKLDPLAPLGSYAGAMGIPQFMPTSFRQWAVDGDGDGHRDLWTDWPDVFASVANYLKVHGWRAGEPVMVPASVDGADLTGLKFGKLELDDTIATLRARGIRFETNLPPESPATLVALHRAVRHRVPGRVHELQRDHALQPQPHVRERGQRSCAGRCDDACPGFGRGSVATSRPSLWPTPFLSANRSHPRRHLRHRLLPRRRRPESASPHIWHFPEPS